VMLLLKEYVGDIAGKDVANPTALLQRFPNLGNSLIAGPYSGHFDNNGERVTLLGSMKETILDFTYDNSWYPTTSGHGFSLVVQNETGTTDLSTAAAWRTSSNLGGSPGMADPAPANIPQVVINELLPHSENSAVPQFIELYNRGSNAVSLADWQFTSGITFTFPTNTSLAAGGYLVVARNLTNLLANNDRLMDGSALTRFGLSAGQGTLYFDSFRLIPFYSRPGAS